MVSPVGQLHSSAVPLMLCLSGSELNFDGAGQCNPSDSVPDLCCRDPA